MSTVPQAIDSNPLVAYRAPLRMPRRHAPVSGRHFVTKREDVMNNDSPLNIFPGDLTYRADPTLELDFALWEDNGSEMSAKEGVSMTMRKGYQEAMAKDFIVADRVKMAWKPDVAGRLTFMGRKGGDTTTPATVLMWRTGADYDRLQAMSPQLKESNSIQTSVEQKMAQSAAAMVQVTGNSDISSFVQLTDEQPETIHIGEEEE